MHCFKEVKKLCLYVEAHSYSLIRKSSDFVKRVVLCLDFLHQNKDRQTVIQSWPTQVTHVLHPDVQVIKWKILFTKKKKKAANHCTLGAEEPSLAMFLLKKKKKAFN